MKAIKVFEKGDSDVLKLVEVEKPKIKDGWSLVKVKGFGINRSEIFTRKGYSSSVTFPRILGIECVGIIEETSDEKNLPINCKVVSIMGEMGREFDGSYAEYVLLPNNQIYKINTEIEWDELASIPETYYTAYGSLKNLKVSEGDTVLVRGATSGVGIAFAKLLKAKYPNIKLFGSTRYENKAKKLNEYGYDDVVLDMDDKLETKLNFDKIFDLIGPKVIKNSISHLNENGIICNTGLLGGSWYLEDFDPIMELKNNVYLTTFYSGNVTEEKLNELFEYIKRYKIKIKPEKIFKLEEIKQAHDYLESSESFGKVVIINE
ncbi:MAG: zinc-binding dehydrogenase [Erysipelotrichaceae bacterium]|nr:zinc-binding dehydrogenase [Erysipelotrichaceae bacterium]